MQLSECPTNDRLTAFLAGRDSPGEREGIEFHLSQCRACRHRLVSLYEASQTESVIVRAPGWLKASARRIPKKRRVIIPSLILGFRRQVAAALAVTALVAVGASLFFLSESRRGHQLPTAEALRQEAQTVPAPRLLAPGAEAVITSDRIEFRWSQVPSASRYTFTLLDGKGDIVFQTSTVDKRLILSMSAVHVERGKPYFWYIGVRLPDGTTVDSEIRKFVLSES